MKYIATIPYSCDHYVLVPALCNDTTVEELNVSNCDLTDKGAVAIISSLKHVKTPKKLDLSYNKISFNGMTTLVKVIKSHQGPLSLVYVDLSNNGSSLIGLDLHHHYNSPSPWGVYSVVIEYCSLTHLTLCGDKGMKEHIKEITDSLQANTALQSLTLFNIGITGVQAIKEVLANNSTLNRLNLSMQKINVKAVEIYILLHKPNTDDEMESQTTAKELRGVVNVVILYDININKKFLLIVLANDECIHLCEPESIKLSNRNMFNDELHLIAFGLCNNTTSLQELNISDNMISDEGVAAIIDILKHNKSLKQLDVSQNMIQIVGMNNMMQFIEDQGTTISLEYIDLSKNNASQWGVYCSIISHCCVNSLTVCGDEGIDGYIFHEEIIKCLDNNVTLQSLMMCNVDEKLHKTFDHILNYEPPTDLKKIGIFKLIPYKKQRCYSLNMISGSHNMITLVVSMNKK